MQPVPFSTLMQGFECEVQVSISNGKVKGKVIPVTGLRG
jgi:hypothetical protein